MKTSSFSLLVLAVMTLAFVVPAHGQTAEPLDAAAAKAQLSQQAKKPRFTPKSAVKSRTYKLTSKGAGVEIVEFEDGQKSEHPYVAVPILFVVGQEELLDSGSAANVQTTANILREIMASEPKARFTIQGHASAEGDMAANRTLSEQRARKIFALLTTQGIDPNRIGKIGFGADFAQARSTAPEAQRQQDRRVLIVRQ